MKILKWITIILISVLAGILLGEFVFQHSFQGAPTGDHAATSPSHTADNHAASPTIWTCSMDPQVRQNEPGDCPICGMDLIPLESMGSASSSHQGLQMTKEAVRLANIQTSIVGTATNRQATTLQLAGKIQADETQSASLVSHIPGRIEKLYLSFTGETVRKGQQIATIYSPELITAQRELLEAQKMVKTSPELLEAAKNKLRYWKISAETVADILEEGVIREQFDLFAEHAGVVTQKQKKPGDYLEEGEVLFELQNLNQVWALFDVYEKDLPNVKVGASVSFTTPSIPNRTFRSRITFVEPTIHPDTRIATIRAEVSNKHQQLKPEMFINGQLQIRKTAANALTVPKTAVLWTGTRSVVYLKIPDTQIPSFEYREIETGERIGNDYQVISGLVAGDEVVTNGAFVVDAAAQLNNQKSMMNQAVTVAKGASDFDLPDYSASTPMVFKESFAEAINAYLQLKDAFVLTDAVIASQRAEQFTRALKNIDGAVLPSEPAKYWSQQTVALEGPAKKIITLDDVSLQREQFDILSQELIQTVRVFGASGMELYLQHCPMVDNNRGADWISNEIAVRNPYFGDKMLTCGVVRDSFIN